MASNGRLIVIEGIDGSGGETQSQLIKDYLESKKMPVERLRYPDYNRPVGKLIDEYLHGKYEMSFDVLTLLHTADRIQDKNKINGLLKKGTSVIADRWFTSTLAFQTAQGFHLDKMIKIGEALEMPKPDIVIYLRISAETSAKRKLGEKGNLDRFEKDKLFLERVVNQYDKLAKENVFGKWVVIDGEQSKERVFEEVKKALGF
ncbi:MAG TPA: dTMP kinase [archaeon]|nr:dTMP kinase [archaeon]